MKTRRTTTMSRDHELQLDETLCVYACLCFSGGEGSKVRSF